MAARLHVRQAARECTDEASHDPLVGLVRDLLPSIVSLRELAEFESNRDSVSPVLPALTRAVRDMESALGAHGIAQISPAPGTPVDESLHAVSAPTLASFTGSTSIGRDDRADDGAAAEVGECLREVTVAASATCAGHPPMHACKHCSENQFASSLLCRDYTL